MKSKILAILIFLLPTVIFAQNNFIIVDSSKVVWQKVFDTELSFDDIHSNIINNGIFSDVVVQDGLITFRVIRGKISVEDMGYIRGSVPIYVVSKDFTSFVTVQVKEGRYRVTAENIILTQRFATSLSEEGETSTLELYAVKCGTFRKGFLKLPSEIYNKYLTDLFAFKGKSYLGNDW